MTRYLSKLRGARRKEQVRAIASFGLGPVLGLASGPVLARALAPEGRGQFAAIMQPISVAGAIASLGVPAAMTYYVARGTTPKVAISAGVRNIVPSALIVYGFMIWYSFSVSRVQAIPQWVLLILWFAVIVSALVQVRRGVWQGVAAWSILDAERALFAVARFTAVVIVALIGTALAGWYAAGALVAFLLAALILWSRPFDPYVVAAPERFTGASNSLSQKDLFRYSLAASAGTISLFANNRIDQILFPVSGSTRELGFYAVAVTVAEVPIVLGTLSARNALTASAQGKPLVVVLNSVKVYLSVALLAAIILGSSASLYVPIVFGRDFTPSALSVSALSVGTAVGVLNLVLTQLFGNMPLAL